MTGSERSFDVDAGFVLPDLNGCLADGAEFVARPPITVRAAYYDTADRRLARTGVEIRYRRGDRALPWTVTLPADSSGERREVARPGSPTAIPAELAALVTAYTRGAALVPAVTLRTRRTRYESSDGNGAAVTVTDDRVAVLDERAVSARFRKIAVAGANGRPALARRVGKALRKAGATESSVPPHIRAIGDGALRPADLPAADALPPRPSAADVTTAALRAHVGRLVAHDPLVRLQAGQQASGGNGDTAVHQMRVGVRRLRSTLRTFESLFVPSWVDPLQDELRWLGGVLGAARDAEVLRARLPLTAATDPLAPPDAIALARLDADLAARHEDARTALEAALTSARYLALVESLYAAAAAPPFAACAGQRAKPVLTRLAARDWHRLVLGAGAVDGAAYLDGTADDRTWHAIRIRAKRARYAVETVVPVAGAAAVTLGKALAALTDLLGAQADACVAGEAWLAIAASDPDDHALAVTAGRLFERERAAVVRVRAGYRPVWRAAAERALTGWIAA